MNKQRRKEIEVLIEALQEIRGKIEDLQNEEQDAFDNMPEGLQQSESGQLSENAAANLQSAYDSLGEVTDGLEEAMQ